MAHIPIEKESRGPAWWLWLLGLLAVAALVWLVASLFDDPEPERADLARGETERMEPAPLVSAAEARPITSVAEILRTANPTTLVGREVALDSLRVERLAGDSTFFVSAAALPSGDRLFAVLRRLGESEHGPGTGADGVYNIDEDDLTSLTGTIARLEPDDLARWGLTGARAQEVVTDQIYLRIRDVSFTERAPADQP